jgi:hypothetical protein
MPNGIMLKAAIKALIRDPYIPTDPIKPSIKEIGRNKSKSARLVKGPATDILPFSLLVILYPDIITAPGAAITNPVNAIIRVKMSIGKLILNSAQHPYRCATSLCAISWNKKAGPIVTSESSIYAGKDRIPLERAIAKAIDIKTQAIKRCLLSVLLDLIFI